jgi:hypothetical protein
LPGNHKESVRLYRLIGDLARGRRCGQARIERAEVGVGVRGEIEPCASARIQKLERRADFGAGFGVADDLESDGVPRLLTRRKQRVQKRRRQRSVCGRLDGPLKSKDRVMRSLAELAVVDPNIKPEPDQSLLHGLARCFRQSQKRGLPRRHRGIVGRRRGGRGLRLRRGERRKKAQDEGEGDATERLSHRSLQIPPWSEALRAIIFPKDP